MLTEPLTEFADEMAQCHNPDIKSLSTAAEYWACHALQTYQGKLLRRALAISAAIVEFTCELENPS